MVEAVQLVGIDELAAVLVRDMSVLFPTVPQALHHVEIFASDTVADGMGRMLGLAEVGGSVAQPRRHDVPARAAAAQMVERGELACDVEGFGIADGERGDEADAGRRCGERGQDGDGFEAVEIMGAGLFRDRQAVGDEEEVEFAPFGGRGLLLIISEAGAGVDVAVRVTPVVPGAADAVEDETELDMALLWHVVLA